MRLSRAYLDVIAYRSLWTLTIFGAVTVALCAGRPTSALASESYPWCTQDETLHCYYMTREQCEETVDYHGFCVANPDIRSAHLR
jgi:hypothetical protein